MKKLKIIRCCLLLFIMISHGLIVVAQRKESVKMTLSIDSMNHWIDKTLNIGFTLEAPHEGEWGHTMKTEEFPQIKEAGFTAIRLPINWVAHMGPSPEFALDAAFLKRVDWAVGQSLQNRLAIILDNQTDEELMSDPAKNRPRFLQLWKQLSEHYSSRSDSVMFEPMAEPHGRLDSVWFDYLRELLKIIRQTNPHRPVIAGPGFYNTIFKLNGFEFPANDPYLIISIHSYAPVKFTMQGEAWFPYGKPLEWIGTQWKGDSSERKEIDNIMLAIKKWSVIHHRPIFLGEFGVGDHADPISKIRYIGYMREVVEKNGFSWGFFNYAVNFSLFNIHTGHWKIEEVRALIPDSKISNL